jgi:hypothetical protein
MFAATTRFAASAVAWTFALLAVIRLTWIEQQLIEWLVAIQRETPG